MLNFSKLKPKVLNPWTQTLTPTQTPTPKLQNPKYKPEILTTIPSFKLQTPTPIMKNMCYFTYYSIFAIITCTISTKHHPQYINWRRFQIILYCWIVTQLNEIFL